MSQGETPYEQLKRFMLGAKRGPSAPRDPPRPLAISRAADALKQTVPDPTDPSQEQHTVSDGELGDDPSLDIQEGDLPR